MVWNIGKYHGSRSDFHKIPYPNIANNGRSGPNETVISDLRCLFANRGNCDILIDVTLLSDFGITGNIYPMQAVR